MRKLTILVVLGLASVGTGSSAGMLELAPSNHLTITNPATEDSRLLVKLDLASIPQGARIQHAELWIDVASCTSNHRALNVSVHEVSRSWTRSANWTQPWARSGGDFDEEVRDAWSVSPGQDRHFRFDVTETVQAWLDGEKTNHGFLIGVDGDPSGRFTRAQGASALKLRVRYKALTR